MGCVVPSPLPLSRIPDLIPSRHRPLGLSQHSEGRRHCVSNSKRVGPSSDQATVTVRGIRNASLGLQPQIPSGALSHNFYCEIQQKLAFRNALTSLVHRRACLSMFWDSEAVYILRPNSNGFMKKISHLYRQFSNERNSGGGPHMISKGPRYLKVTLALTFPTSFDL